MDNIVTLMAEALEPLECPLYANEAKKAGECVVYTFNTTYYNAARRETRMKLHIAADTMKRSLELEEALDRALVPMGEGPVTQGVTSSVRNGGGWLIDGDMHIRIAYYDFVLRPERR